ncbi:MAG: SEC-C domain-containing protein [Myxococcota bacterium]
MARRTRVDRRRRSRATRASEWVGGRLAPPFFVTDAEEPYRAQVALWLELPEGFIVGQELTGPAEAEGALGRALSASLERPLVGPPRRPARIRVANEALAAEVRAVSGDGIPIRVAPTPELDEVLESMIEAMPRDRQEESYLEDGRIPQEAVAELFHSAEYLYRVAPWRVASDDQVVRIDIPELGIAGTCLSIIGALGESLGVVLFSSLADYEAFRAEEPRPSGEPIDLGSEYLALSFQRGADLPTRMLREVAEHGWPVAAPDAYPRLLRVERDGAAPPLAERDFRVAAACARALPRFFLRHRERFADDDMEPACESFSNDIGPTVRITAPYEALPPFAVEDERLDESFRSGTRAPRPGRNDPCHCGSGRKYKKCHLQADERARSAESRAAALHALDKRLVTEISALAFARFGLEARGWTRDFDDPAQVLPLAIPWSVYHFEVQGRPAFEWYLEEEKPRPSSDERRWLDAQRAAWLSIWEVTEMRPGEGLTLRDLLTDEERRVQEVLATETLVKRDCILARVVELDDAAVLGGTHPRPLPPSQAAEIVRRARNRLRRKRAVPPERLRDEKLGRYLIRRWEEAVAALESLWSKPPQLCNTDGEPFILTTDHFELAADARDEVAARLAALDGVVPPDPDAAEPSYEFLRDPPPGTPPAPGATLLGRARLSNERLILETNSVARADALRRRIEEACAKLVRHRAREHTDPLSEPVRRDAAERARRPEEAPPPEAQQLVLDFKRAHYAGWANQALPALGGKSPRDAVRTPTGRAAVDVLLKDMENLEQRSPSSERFDFSELRGKLGLDD